VSKGGGGRGVTSKIDKYSPFNYLKGENLGEEVCLGGGGGNKFGKGKKRTGAFRKASSLINLPKKIKHEPDAGTRKV